MHPESTGPEDPQARLQRLRAEVEEALARRDIAGDDERGDGHHHPAEAATDADLRERDLRGQLRWREREQRLRAALAAIDAGTYGICVDCGVEIPEGRLRALPDSVRCVPCQRVASRKA
jgi:DnaK suppressor protein